MHIINARKGTLRSRVPCIVRKRPKTLENVRKRPKTLEMSETSKTSKAYSRRAAHRLPRLLPGGGCGRVAVATVAATAAAAIAAWSAWGCFAPRLEAGGVPSVGMADSI